MHDYDQTDRTDSVVQKIVRKNKIQQWRFERFFSFFCLKIYLVLNFDMSMKRNSRMECMQQKLTGFVENTRHKFNDLCKT